jgi:hypothetical protein
MRWRELAHLVIPALVVIGLIGWSRPAGPPAAAGVAAMVEDGCYLNFVARNEGSSPVFIDIANSRIRSGGSPMYPIGSWAKIINTQSQNIHAGTRRTFTVWARLCGLAGLVHQVDFKLKRGADAVSVRALHGGGDKVDNLGDLNRYF